MARLLPTNCTEVGLRMIDEAVVGGSNLKRKKRARDWFTTTNFWGYISHISEKHVTVRTQTQRVGSFRKGRLLQLHKYVETAIKNLLSDCDV